MRIPRKLGKPLPSSANSHARSVRSAELYDATPTVCRCGFQTKAAYVFAPTKSGSAVSMLSCSSSVVVASVVVAAVVVVAFLSSRKRGRAVELGVGVGASDGSSDSLGRCLVRGS